MQPVQPNYGIGLWTKKYLQLGENFYLDRTSYAIRLRHFVQSPIRHNFGLVSTNADASIKQFSPAEVDTSQSSASYVRII